MNLEALKSKLDESEFSQLQTYVQTLIGQKDEARAESISGRKALKAEVEALRKTKEALFDKLGLDDDADIDSFQVPTKDAGVEVSKKYESRIKKLEQELKLANESLTGLDSKYKGTLLEAQLSKAISAHDFVDADLVREFAKGRVKYEGEEVVFTDGDKILSVDEGIKLLATTKPHLLKAQGTGGSGFNPTSTSGKTKGFGEMTLTEKTELYKADPTRYAELKKAA